MKEVDPFERGEKRSSARRVICGDHCTFRKHEGVFMIFIFHYQAILSLWLCLDRYHGIAIHHPE